MRVLGADDHGWDQGRHGRLRPPKHDTFHARGHREARPVARVEGEVGEVLEAQERGGVRSVEEDLLGGE